MALAIAVLLLVVALFGDTPLYEKTVIRRFRSSSSLFAKKFGAVIFECDRRFLNGTVSRFWQAYGGWTVPLLYLIIFCKCVSIFFTVVYDFHSVEFFSIILPILTAHGVAFAKTIITSPGYVEGYYEDLLEKFPYNGIIFHQTGNHRDNCSTCGTLRVARSKHCGSCGHCVLFFDHHCVWFNNCIGMRNYRWFFSFLTSLIAVLVVGALETGGCLLDQMKLQDSPKTRLLGRYWWLITKTTFKAEMTGVLFILCVLFTPIVIVFTLDQLNYIYMGMTTNESLKWLRVQDLVRKGKLYHSLSDEGLYAVQLSDRFVRLSDLTEVVSAEWNRVDDIEDVPNIYDRGFKENFRQRMRG